MRGIYWLKMPEFATLNFFSHTEKLPDWFWTGKTKMNCLKDAITQSLEYAYAHHIQRLMITGNFALLAGVHPDEVDAWYLGIYIDAIEWVEITNTRGMSQFADGGIVGTKPYVSSASYIDKMSHYCGSCYYDKKKKTGDKACPFNSLYWNFYDKHEDKLAKNPRIGMMYNVWRKMKPEDKGSLLEQADYYLKNINEL
jgi:deoxyribodipyrimidine photolyase-related protein